MPVQFSPAKITADSLDSSLEPITQQELFKNACYDQYNISNEIFQSSFSGQLDILPKSNGFVETLTAAYNHHRGLIIRPDDVWVAILVQFNFFVNANAELLRKQFVSHQGQKSLKVTAAGNRYNVDFGKMAKDMTREIDNNVVDPSLRAWILPKFTTTTDNDTIVSSVVMMATMKKYFKYSFSLMCGLPRVTLEGEKSDWEEILGRLEKLKEYGIKTTAWYHLLKPVISRFVKAFDDPNGAENLDFWGRICHRTGGGSGPTFLGGWITAFCAFDSDGNWMGQQFIDESAAPAELSSLSASDFFAKYTRKTDDQELLVVDGTPYHVVNTNDIPNGYAEVNVTLNDNGLEIESKMAAGHVGMQVCSSGDKQLSSTGDRDTIKPASGWWMFSILPEGQIKKDTDTY